MELDSTIEPTIGPYEAYEDAWFNYKASFEAFVTIRDDAETTNLQQFGQHLQHLEDTLPIAPRFRNPMLGQLAPIRVVNVVFTAGNANNGVQTAAFNLPNDERVVREKWSKRIMLKNIQDAKLQHVLASISEIALRPAEQIEISFDAFFTHILMHELMHGLGPGTITVDGRETTVRQELIEGNPQHSRRGEGGHSWTVGLVPAYRPRCCRRVVGAQHVHDVPGFDVSFYPLRDQRSPWPRCRYSTQYLPRHRSSHDRFRRPFRDRSQPYPSDCPRADVRIDDHTGHRRL